MSRGFSALLFILSVPGIVSAQCRKPVITNPVGASDSTGTQLTVTWTTNVPADSMVIYGYPIAGTATPILDTNGVTNHSVTITGLSPGTQYNWGFRSRAIVNGAPCGPGYRAFSGGPGSKYTAMSAPPSGTFTYKVVPAGPTYVTQNYGMYFIIRLPALTGTYTPNSLTMVLSGLPPYTSVRWSDPQLWHATDAVSTTSVTGDTLKIYNWYPHEPYILTNVGGTTPPGNYTITITASATDGGDTPPRVVATWPFHVVSASTPFSGVAFPYGTPSSYPAIPNLSTFKASADIYGEQTCAQDQDTSHRKIRANNKAHLTPVATCCTYASWFYDGVQVYYNVENMLQNGKDWAQCRTNVKEVYRDKYALPQNGKIQSFMMFSEGYYTDYLITRDDADLTLINDWLSNIYNPTHGVYVDVGYLQREVAYTLRNGIHGVALGQNQTAFHQTSAFMRDYALDHVLGQIDQLCLSQNAQYFENFMIGLQAEALTQYYNLVSHDPRIAPALACVANWQYSNMWQASQTGSFPYDKYQWIMGITEADSGSCMTTLNNLISPMYAWLFKMSGNLTYQIEGDAIFSHGALFDGCKQSGPSGYLTFPFDSNGKTFSQNYYWGTRYVEWRSPPKFGHSQNE